MSNTIKIKSKQHRSKGNYGPDKATLKAAKKKQRKEEAVMRKTGKRRAKRRQNRSRLRT